jgi:hypothetical protein
MLRVATLIFVSACLITQHAGARLGETKAQLDARYGRSVKKLQADPGEEMFEYRHKDLFVLVTFVHGKSEMEIYAHQDGKTPLTQNEIESFLNINSFDKRWEKSAEIPVWSLGGSDPRTWIAMAAYYPKSPHIIAPGLSIMTTGYAKQHGFMPNI